MHDVFSILVDYHKVHPTTWMYLSSLLTIGLYFKFSRVWSVRNFDLLALILFAPGLLLVFSGRDQAMDAREFAGYVWLFAIGAVFIFRLLADSTMVRRPLLEPNLSVGGTIFLGCSLLLFLMANVLNSDRAELDVPPPEVIAAEFDAEDVEPPSDLRRLGPRHPLMNLLPRIVTQTFGGSSRSPHGDTIDRTARVDGVWIAVARTLAILSHLAVVAGMVVIGYRHFDNIKTGIAAAVLYLLLPYTAAMTGHVEHVLPAAYLVWAIVFYRRPMLSGIFIGLAMGTVYYPVFLLPLWISFYWHRGLLRFCLGVAASLAAAVAVVAVIRRRSLGDFWTDLQQMFGLASPSMDKDLLEGFWGFDGIHPEYRLPLLALCIALSGSMALWPAQKNLGTLMSCSAAIMLAVQFWHAHGGGLFIGWYLPLLLLTVFRPNLEDRVALSVLGEGWLTRRRPTFAGRGKAA